MLHPDIRNGGTGGRALKDQLPRVGIPGAGEMGAALAGSLNREGLETFAVEEGRSTETQARMDEAGMHGVPNLVGLVESSDILFSILPPEVAETEASRVAERFPAVANHLVLVEANAISPGRVQRIASFFTGIRANFIDGGIVGLPPLKDDRPRLYASGNGLGSIARLDGTGFDLCLLGAEIGLA